MTYLLSNIAKSCIAQKNIPNILYLPSMSIVDTLISSLPDINILNTKNYWMNNIDAIIYNPRHASINEQDLLWQYHFKIIKISTDHDQEQLDYNIRNLYINVDQIIVEQQPIKNKKLLLYILDTDNFKATMTLEYLNSLQINFTVLKPTELIGLKLIELNKIISEFQFVVNNTSIENLILVDKIGPTPITFMPELASKNNCIKLVNHNNFEHTLYSTSEHQQVGRGSNIDEILNDLSLTITNLIYQTPFIL